jgi:pyrroline-5-carboxylate reductase
MTTAKLLEQRIGFIGCGAMAEALAGGLIAAGLPPERISGSDPMLAQRERFQKALGPVGTFESNAEVVREADMVVLAVKPDRVVVALESLANAGDLARPLWISIAAGVSLASLGGALPETARIVRAMPNTPALVRAGATALYANDAVEALDREVAGGLFDAVGVTWWSSSEDLLNAVTGLSGSGPAYVFLLLEALGDAGVRVGLPRAAAYQLALQTVYGAAKLALETGEHPGALKDRVTSPGGTTIAGLERLEIGGVRAAVYSAVEAATNRSRELSGS